MRLSLHTLKGPVVSVATVEGRGGGVEDVPCNYMGCGPVFTAVNSDFIRGAERVLVLTGSTSGSKSAATVVIFPSAIFRN